MYKISKSELSVFDSHQQVLAGESVLSDEHFSKLSAHEGSEKALMQKLKVQKDKLKDGSKHAT